ncbi:MAG: aldo/keto reductase [Planctomycetota bacterium]|jgi:myo-inositol catabolism protein IolS|nr:aldo/keto reductase [Planctomycetota bacterium]
MSTLSTDTDLITELNQHGALSLGTWAFGGNQWGGEQSDADSFASMATAVEAGLTHFDTAGGYGGGHSEKLIGEFLRSDPAAKSKVFVASKVFPKPNADAEFAYNGVCKSLERMGLDQIDLYYLHWPRNDMDLREPLKGLERAREEGLIRYVGVSNFNVEQLEQGLEVSRIEAHQFCYNLIWRLPEQAVLPFCQHHGIASVTYSSIAQGVLTGKFGASPAFQEGDARAKTVIFEPEVWPKVHAAIEQLKGVAKDACRPLTHLAIRWVAAQQGVNSVLVGARNVDQVAANAAAAAGDIDPNVFARMTAISDQLAADLPAVTNLWRNEF